MTAHRPLIGFVGATNELREATDTDGIVVQRFADSNGAYYLSVATVASQANGWLLLPAVAGSSPELWAYGVSTDISLVIKPKGAGKLFVVSAGNTVEVLNIVDAQAPFAKDLRHPSNLLPFNPAERAVRQYPKNPGAATFANVGFSAAATLTAAGGSFASGDVDVRPLCLFTTSATTDTQAELSSPADVKGQWVPRVVIPIRTGADIDHTNIYAGLFASSPLAGEHLAVLGVGFKYSERASDTNWIFTSYDGSTLVEVDTAVEVLPDTDYVFDIEKRESGGWWGRINATDAPQGLESDLPDDNQALAMRVGVRTTDAGARTVLVGSIPLWMR